MATTIVYVSLGIYLCIRMRLSVRLYVCARVCALSSVSACTGKRWLNQNARNSTQPGDLELSTVVCVCV